MKPLEYKAFCETTYACPPGTNREEYLQMLLIEELGEVASLFAKAMRDGKQIVDLDECEGCRGHGKTRCSYQKGRFDKCEECRGTGLTEDWERLKPRIYGREAVNHSSLLKELGDVMWCAAMLADIEDIEEWFAWPQFLDPFGIKDWNHFVYGCSTQLEAACSMCQFYGFTPEEVALANVEKLKGRVQRGTLHGNGDER